MDLLLTVNQALYIHFVFKFVFITTVGIGIISIREWRLGNLAPNTPIKWQDEIRTRFNLSLCSRDPLF